jgi:4-hydroxy-3-polyprenylbenzoate decarboxylase
MAYKSLSHFISVLESAGELARIKEFVSPRLEMTEIADRMVKHGGKALLFENNGTPFPVLINAFASDERICMALGVKNLDDTGNRIGQLLKDFGSPKESIIDKLRMLPTLREVSSWMPRTVSGRGSCQEVVMTEPDLTRLPVLTCWPADGGPFITLPAVHTKDPETGARNLGMYRMQVFGSCLTGMHWHLHKGSAHHYQKYKAAGKRMPVTVTLGGDPAYTYAATAPLPENLDEYLLAGFLRKKRVELVRCLTNDLEVPADVDFVIEGYVDPQEEPIWEGPFGDHTGFYSLAGYFPRFHVTCITHRRDAVYPATIVGIPPQEDGWIGKATEKIFLTPIKTTVAPEVVDMHMPVEGVFHNITLVSIDKSYPGQAFKIMNSLWGAGQMMFNKIMAVTDGDIVLSDLAALARRITEQTDPVEDIQFVRGPVDILDHSSNRYAFGSKIGIDATREVRPSNTAELSEVPFIDSGRIRSRFPEITGINSDLPAEGISLLILAIRKDRRNHLREVSKELLTGRLAGGFKFVVFIDSPLDVQRLGDVTWITANNLDPLRDCFYVEVENCKIPCLFLDGTRKTRELDEFERDWPNVIIMDDATIRAIDQKWSTLGLGSLIPSPSIRYKSLVASDGALA